MNSEDWIEMHEDHIICKVCGATVQRGIISVSSHWAECAGKEQMDFINKVAQSNLKIEDKMSLIKKQYSIEQ